MKDTAMVSVMASQQQRRKAQIPVRSVLRWVVRTGPGKDSSIISGSSMSRFDGTPKAETGLGMVGRRSRFRIQQTPHGA